MSVQERNSNSLPIPEISAHQAGPGGDSMKTVVGLRERTELVIAVDDFVSASRALPYGKPVTGRELMEARELLSQFNVSADNLVSVIKDFHIGLLSKTERLICDAIEANLTQAKITHRGFDLVQDIPPANADYFFISGDIQSEQLFNLSIKQCGMLKRALES